MATTTSTTQPTPTEDQLRKQAETQIGSEISGETAPYQSQIGSLQSRETSSLQQIGQMFGNIQPSVEQGAAAVKDAYDQAQQAQQGIFAAATQRLAQLKQGRAQEAQALAQEMGGPVAVGEFTSSIDPAQESLAGYAPNALIHSLGNAQAGVQEAQAFSGKVFPLLRTEEEGKARGTFEAQIKEAQDAINAIEGQKTSRTNTRFAELQSKQHQYDLDAANHALDVLKANRDWQATLRSLHNDEARIKIAQQQQRLENKRFGLESKKTTAEIIHLSAADKLAARQMGLSEKEFSQRIKQIDASRKLSVQRQTTAQQKFAAEIVDAATNPQPGKTVTQTQKVYMDSQQARMAALRNPASGITYETGPKTPDHPDGKYWYVLKDVKTAAPTMTPVSDPQKLYDLLVGYKIPASMALKLVKARLGLQNFTPGKTNYTHDELGAMPFNEVRGIAMRLGFRPDPKNPRTKQQILDFIYEHQ